MYLRYAMPAITSVLEGPLSCVFIDIGNTEAFDFISILLKKIYSIHFLNIFCMLTSTNLYFKRNKSVCKFFIETLGIFNDFYYGGLCTTSQTTRNFL